MDYKISKTKKITLLLSICILPSFILFELIFNRFFDEIWGAFFYIIQIISIVSYLLVYLFFIDYFKFWKQRLLYILTIIMLMSTLIGFIFTILIRFKLIVFDFSLLSIFNFINIPLIISLIWAIVVLRIKTIEDNSLRYLKNIAICIIIDTLLIIVFQLSVGYTALFWKGLDFIAYIGYILFIPKIFEIVYFILLLNSLKKNNTA